MIVVALSSRSPYRRGGLRFDAVSARAPDGRAMVEIDAFIAHRIGAAGMRELLADPAIELRFPLPVGRRAAPDAPALPAAPPSRLSAFSKPLKPSSRPGRGGAKRKAADEGAAA